MPTVGLAAVVFVEILAWANFSDAELLCFSPLDLLALFGSKLPGLAIPDVWETLTFDTLELLLAEGAATPKFRLLLIPNAKTNPTKLYYAITYFKMIPTFAYLWQQV